MRHKYVPPENPFSEMGNFVITEIICTLLNAKAKLASSCVCVPITPLIYKQFDASNVLLDILDPL